MLATKININQRGVGTYRSAIINKHGYVFFRSQYYCSPELAEMAANKAAKRKNIGIEEGEIEIIVE